MSDVFDNAYLSCARHSLLTPETLGFAYRENGEILFSRSESSETEIITEDPAGDGGLIHVLFEHNPDKNAAVILYGGFSLDFVLSGSDLPVVNPKCRAMIGDKVMCVTHDDIMNGADSSPVSAVLIEDRFAAVFADSIDSAIEKALSLEYSAKIAAISSFLAGK